MDLGMVGLDGLVGSGTSLANSSSSTDPEAKQKWYGSAAGCTTLKQERSGGSSEDEWRSLKVAKTDDFSASKPMLLQQRGGGPLLRSSSTLFSDGQQMLSFSSPTSQTVPLPYYARNSGYGSGGGLNPAASMHGIFTGVRGPFTPSQWMELEHQALIYKHIIYNVPVPSNLLIPIRKALDSAGFSAFSAASLAPSTYGWGAFRLGFTSTTDPEPGRCRRTDGKKWRCSRDAVPDQKYCERHMNRGRHRSRKPVEGQNGHSVSGPTSTAAKLLPTTSSTSASAAPGGGTSGSFTLADNTQLKNLQPGCSFPTQINRIGLSKDNAGERIQDSTDLSILSPTIGLKENRFSFPKQNPPFEESSRPEFGRVCSDSLLNPLQKSSPLISCRSYGSCQDLNDRENESQVRHFIDDWPKNQIVHNSSISWPGIDLQADRTQLSISIPVSASDFMSSTSSPDNSKLALSPLRLSRELEMGLGVGSETNQKQANWIPISWETSMGGGPLGEVLNSSNSGTGDGKSLSALNLMTEVASPTGVLQKITFGSLSNSSAGSSPTAESHKAHEGAASSSLCNDLLGSTTLVSSSSLPAL
ncbi:growth-regulating factor 1-like [Diospyros lotus]|uniref:growth-regulating factor 1-like n=1 Tax=Diospyros lotus TaxID=55363 RepID=UPI0022588F1C|nr:growth-regulating factor 1-like [Diospyros lotus]